MKCFLCTGDLLSSIIETRKHSIIISKCEECDNEEIQIVDSLYNFELGKKIWKEQFGDDTVWVTPDEIDQEIQRYLNINSKENQREEVSK